MDLTWALIYWLCLRGRAIARRWRRSCTNCRVPTCGDAKEAGLVLMMVLAGFLAGVPPAMMAAIGAALLLITRTVEPRKVYQESTGAC